MSPSGTASGPGLARHAGRIAASGNREAEAILAEARRKCEDILAEAKARSEQARHDARERALDEATRLEHQEVSGAELEARKMLLTAQKDVLDAVVGSAIKKLGSLPAEAERQILARLLARAGKVIPRGRVYARPEHASQITSAGYEHAGSDRISAGGIIVESEDGRIRLDLRYESLVQEAWNRNVKEIVDALFG